MKEMIQVQNVEYTYRPHSHELIGTTALSDINVAIEKGQFVVVLGRNGSGKSTFARLLNALLIPTRGTVVIQNMNTADERNIWKIRRTSGMVFQNPDNQIIGTVVEEDVAFGPENLGIPPHEIRQRVETALKTVGIHELSKHAPHLLSGGQKQRVAIAGILAMKPECIILDEATSMLDPVGRKEVIHVLRKLNREEKITIIHITHHMDEAVMADRVILFNKGRVESLGSPREIFSNVEKIKGLGLEVPQVAELIHELNQEGFDFPTNILTLDEAYEAFKKILEPGE